MAADNRGPAWAPSLHDELSRHAERLRVRPKDECSSIAGLALAIALVKLRDDPTLLEDKPSEDIRRFSYGVTSNLAADHHRRRVPRPVSDLPATDDDQQRDPESPSPPVGHELENEDESERLLRRIEAAKQRLCSEIENRFRRDYARAVVDAYVELVPTADKVPSGRSLGKRVTEQGVRQANGRPFRENTACEVLLRLFELLGEDEG